MENEKRLLIDVISKYIVLFIFSGCIGYIIVSGNKVDLPDWIVVIATLVFQYFFRRSPKETPK